MLGLVPPSAYLPVRRTTLAYAENVGSQFLSLRQSFHQTFIRDGIHGIQPAGFWTFVAKDFERQNLS